MRWLMDETCSPAVAESLKKREDTVQTLADLALEPGDHATLLKQAHQKQLDLITANADLASFAIEHGGFGRSIVYLQVEGGEVEQDDALTRLFERYKRLTPGRLYTVTASRVKIRQLPKT